MILVAVLLGYRLIAYPYSVGSVAVCPWHWETFEISFGGRGLFEEAEQNWGGNFLTAI